MQKLMAKTAKKNNVHIQSDSTEWAVRKWEALPAMQVLKDSLLGLLSARLSYSLSLAPLLLGIPFLYRFKFTSPFHESIQTG